MGLAERRGIEAFKTQLYPGLKKKIDEAAGFEVNVEVDWDSLAAEGWAPRYNESLDKTYFIPIIEAFKQICRDAMGKEAMAKALKSIKIRNTNQHTTFYEFNDGVLLVDNCWGNEQRAEERAGRIVELVESKL